MFDKSWMQAVGTTGNYAVLRGSRVKMTCIPKESKGRLERESGLAYTWTDTDDREIVDSRFTKFEGGELEVVNAHVSDSGIYRCTAKLPSLGPSPKPKSTYSHKLVGRNSTLPLWQEFLTFY
ncbi:ig-like domain-containing protein [Caerostris darwini]|uniref:Ig-like domain-containing protein n=1 Tax=Caerostris darwini TaxID=1538125 RepID=A0AAV4SJN9_9ARAC|nr:ig-like domain-containing protein [Caerostris darwini]